MYLITKMMIATCLLFLASAGYAVAAEKQSSSPADALSVSASVESGKTYITIKIPYGQSANISCPQKLTDTAASTTKPPSRGGSKKPSAAKDPVQTVQIVGGKYLVPAGAKNCESDNVMYTPEFGACDKAKSTSCAFRSNDASKKKGCEKRRLGIRYVCADALPPPPKNVPGLMVNNMIGDFD